MLRRSLHIASRQLFYFIVTTVIVGLIGVLLAVWLSEEIAKRKDELAAWVSEQSGYPVELGDAGLYLFDLIPKLQLNQLSVKQEDTGESVLTIQQVFIGVDLLASLHQQQLVLSGASLNHVRVSVKRNVDNQFTLGEIKKTADHATTDITLQAVVKNIGWLKKLNLTDIGVQYRDVVQPDLSGFYDVQNAELNTENPLWQLNAKLNLPEQLGRDVQLRAQLKTDADAKLTDWQCQIDATALQLKSVLASYVFDGVGIDQGSASVKGVLDYQHASDQLTAEIGFDLTDLNLFAIDASKQVEPVSIGQFQGQLDIKKRNQAWQVRADNLRVKIAGDSWPLTQFELSYADDGDVDASADYVRLSDVTSIALLLNNAPEVIKQMRPAGDINRLQIHYSPATGLSHLSMRATEVAMLPWQDYPGATNLSFSLDWKDGLGSIDLNSHRTTFYADKWLEKPLYFESLTGKLDWQQHDKDWQIHAAGLRLWNEDLSLQADGMIQQKQQKLDSDITFNVQDLEVNRWKSYVPQKILQPEFKAWSAEAFVAGKVVDGVISLKGDPLAFPFDKQPDAGQFDMALNAKDVQLHFAEGWPDLMNVNGKISGQGNNLLITSQSGQIADIQFVDVTTKIENLVRHNPILTVDGKVSGTSSQALAFLNKSPLQHRFGSIGEWVAVTGKSDINLDLTVPLTHVVDTDVEGEVTFENSALTTRAVPGLKVQAINGALAFNNHGVAAKNITGQTLGNPIRVDVSNQSKQTLVDIHGSTAMSNLAELWPALIPDFVKGQASYQTQLVISEPKPGDFGVAVNVNSDLKGVTIDTPQPLGKTAQQSRSFKLNIAEKGKTGLHYQLSYEDWLYGRFSQGDDGRLGGLVSFGKDVNQFDPDQFNIMGQLTELDADAWLLWQSQHENKNSDYQQYLNKLDVSVDKLSLFGQKFDGVHVNLSPKQEQWDLSLSATQFKGTVSLPQETNSLLPIKADFDYVHMTLPSTDQTSDETASIALWPAMNVTIADLQLDGISLGQLNMNATRSPNQWTLASASLNSELYSAQASGVWSKDSEQETSQFELKSKSDNIKELFAHFGYQQVIEARKMRLSSKLNWHGNPLAISRKTMNGNMNIDVGRGQLLDVEPGAAGRIFGLMSIAALPRRLALDFSELFGKGLDFSSIRGNFSFNNGIAQTNDLTLQGDSAKIEVAGPIDLVNKTYNQTVKITPNVSSTLPLAGAVAGGPVGLGVGAAILLVDKLADRIFDREIVNLISYNYRLTGPWDEPELKIVATASN